MTGRDRTFGGAFLYHQEPNLLLAGLVIGLDYENPYLNPYLEFQRWKTHKDIAVHFEGGTCISYGARVLNEGGYHSIPQLSFPGGALIGCSAGFLNAVKIKGTHNAMKSGTVAAECIFDLLNKSTKTPVGDSGRIDEDEEVIEVSAYEEEMSKSWVYKELFPVRNCHDAFRRWGVGPGLLYTGFATHLSRGREPWTWIHRGQDSDSTKEARLFSPKSYPPPDGILTFDLLTNLQRSGTYHEEDQETHLRIKPSLQYIPEQVSFQTYAAPEQRFCPAGVYEYVDDLPHESSQVNKDESHCTQVQKKLVINAQNCIHCKCCSIKAPQQYIQWTVPEGGGGPNYKIM
jgi:electron-transferring-flavoprotein dehydrogenase